MSSKNLIIIILICNSFIVNGQRSGESLFYETHKLKLLKPEYISPNPFYINDSVSNRKRMLNKVKTCTSVEKEEHRSYTTVFYYNKRGQPDSIISKFNTKDFYSYNEKGLLKREVAPPNINLYEYDSIGRIIRDIHYLTYNTTQSDTSKINYFYDTLNRLIRIEEDSDVYTIDYFVRNKYYDEINYKKNNKIIQHVLIKHGLLSEDYQEVIIYDENNEFDKYVLIADNRIFIRTNKCSWVYEYENGLITRYFYFTDGTFEPITKERVYKYNNLGLLESVKIIEPKKSIYVDNTTIYEYHYTFYE